MQRFRWFLWLCALTAGRTLAWTKVCSSDSPCVGQTLECPDSRDCFFRCLDEGVCADSSLLCSHSATGGCHVSCEALNSCRDATLESERDSTIECGGDYSCLRMAATVGRDSANLSLAVSCDGLHSCFHSRLQMYSEGGSATVNCADLGTNDTHTCEDLSLVCGMSETGNCEAASGGSYACDGADANRLLCANSELCTADTDCFTLFDTATISFLISNGPLNESNECVGGVQLAAGSELPPNGLMACASLSDAYAKCYEMTQTGALKQWAEGVGLNTDLSNAVADSCEFLFASFYDREPVAVAATNQFAVDYEYGFEAYFYPWQHSVNSALRNALAEAGALNKSKIEVEVSSAPFLNVGNVVIDSFFQLRALEFTAVNALNAPMIKVTNAPKTAVQLTDILANQIESTKNLLHFKGCTVDVFDSAFVDGTAHDSSVIYCKDCALAVASCRFEDNANDDGVLNLEYGSILSFTESTCAGNSGENGGCIFAQYNCELFLAQSSFLDNSATCGGALYSEEFCQISASNCTFTANNAVYGGVVQTMDDSPVSLWKCAFVANTASYAGAVVYAYYNSPVSATQCAFTANNATGVVSFGGVFDAMDSPVFASNCSFTANSAGKGGVVESYRSSVLASNCTFNANSARYYGGALYLRLLAPVSASNCVFTANTADLDGGVIFAWLESEVSLSNCALSANTAGGNGGAVFVMWNNPFSATNSTFNANSADGNGGAVFAEKNATVSLSNCALTANNANGNGGVVNADENSPVYATHCIFAANNANGSGGVVYALLNSLFSTLNSTFTHNNATDDGGAVFVDNKVFASDCEFAANNATNGGAVFCSESVFGETLFDSNGAMQKGGAVYAGSSLSCDKCTVIANYATKGGGFYMEYKSSVAVTNSTAIWNAAGFGGFMAVKNEATVVISDSIFEHNSAQRGGSVLLSESSTFGSERNVYQNNWATQRGGALASEYKNRLSLFDDVFKGNRAPDGAHIVSDSGALLDVFGTEFVECQSTNGGILLSATKSLFVSCVFTDNLAHEIGGALLMRFDPGSIATKCQFARNKATIGGAVFVAETSDALIELSDCQFHANVADGSGAAVAVNGQNENVIISLTNGSFVGNVAGFHGTVAITEKMANHWYFINCMFAANRAPNGYSAGVYANAPLTLLRLDNCTFAGNSADDSFNASTIFVEAIDGVEVTNSSFGNGEEVLVRKAASVELVENEFGAHSTVTLLNSEKAAIGSLLMEANDMHSTTALRSFPVSLGLEVVENEAKRSDEICPNCELTVAVNGTDIFGNDYSPLKWCDSHKACFDVQLQWAQEIEHLLDDFGTNEDFWHGKGQSTFWLTPLRKKSVVSLSLECVSSADVFHVCEFNHSLSSALPVTDCPKGEYERGDDYFECEAIGSLSADNYSVVEKEYFWLIPLFAATLGAFVCLLWLKDKSIVPPFNVLCCANRVEGASFFAPAIYAWHCFDFLSDVNLSQSLFRVYFHSKARGFNEATNWQWIALAILSAVFVALPFGINVYFAWKLPELVKSKASKNAFAQGFVRDKGKVVALACLWSGNLYATLQLLNSRILGIGHFYMGLTKSQMHAFLEFRVYNVFAENFPQLIIQVLALIKDATDGDGSNVSMAVLLSFVSSLFSAVTILFEKAFAKADAIEEVDFEATIEVAVGGLEATRLSRADLLAFIRNQHRFRNVARALCEDLGLKLSQVQLGYTAKKGGGCVVYGQMEAAAAKGVSNLGQGTYDCIWKQVFGAKSPVTGSFKLLTSSAPPVAGRVLSLSTDATDDNGDHFFEDQVVDDFCTKYGNDEFEVREFFRTVYARGVADSHEHGGDAVAKDTSSVALEMMPLTTDK